MESTDRSIRRLRLAEADDAARITAIYAPFCLETAVSFETVAPDEATTRERIRGLAELHPWLVAVRKRVMYLVMLMQPNTVRELPTGGRSTLPFI